jgi:clan AA aspartic protease (TIGR02281 family)
MPPRNTSETLLFIRDLIERCAIVVVGCSLLLLIVSYHPDAASEQLNIQWQNKQEQLAHTDPGWANLPILGDVLGFLQPTTPQAPVGARLATTPTNSVPLPEEAATEEKTLDPSPLDSEKGGPVPVAASPSTPKAPVGWFENLKNAWPWKKKSTMPVPSLADMPTEPSPLKPASIKSNTRAFTTVPMSLEPKALFVKVNVNDRSSGHFILDTGATYTSISRRMAQELGFDLNETETISITTANGELQVPKVRLKTVKVNNIEASDVEATVMDFEENASFSGLLGLSFIQHFKLTLDPQNGQMRFEPLR